MSLANTVIKGLKKGANNISNSTKNAKQILTEFANKVKSSYDNFFSNFKINSLLHKCGAKQIYGYTPLSIFGTFFKTFLKGTNFYYESKFAEFCDVSKDAGYEFLKTPNINWRQFQYDVAEQAIDLLTEINDDDQRDSVLILDDTPLKKDSSKNIELSAKKFDHSSQKYFRGFSVLTLAYTDQASTFCVAQSILSSPNAENIFVPARNDFDSRSLGARRRAEAIQHMPDVAYNLVDDAINAGINATAAVFDSWFANAPFLIRLGKLIPCIGILKKNTALSYLLHGKTMTIEGIYRSLKNKRRGKANIICSCIVIVKDKEGNSIPAKIVFVRDSNTHD